MYVKFQITIGSWRGLRMVLAGVWAGKVGLLEAGARMGLIAGGFFFLKGAVVWDLE